jgi:hypothetical protein
MAIMAVMTLYKTGWKYGLPWCLSKVEQKCRSTTSKYMQMAKSYSRNKFIAKIMAISVVF